MYMAKQGAIWTLRKHVSRGIVVKSIRSMVQSWSRLWSMFASLEAAREQLVRGRVLRQSRRR